VPEMQQKEEQQGWQQQRPTVAASCAITAVEAAVAAALCCGINVGAWQGQAAIFCGHLLPSHNRNLHASNAGRVFSTSQLDSAACVTPVFTPCQHNYTFNI
jgi:hypothetical protein